ncbi:phage shock protein C (PspC) family protein [Marinactinospora thermotolerans DSM 45154]|uniref:Phage shock protein C (PspC) family protein n=1 Tax=Marinactinospora thermotolerans DSM 45154 TaxID=1122192 RepID=A0A1T4TF51_9ACTN|nr:PspC domain-containing protein [Marinactinospora thermotolerans]SKA39087.1 phage shock protein C (PspC) family protein [Marinactinospora thermotolerans DSM 45154]
MEEYEPARHEGAWPRGGATAADASAPPSVERELRKDDASGAITGVCAGLGAYTRVDPVVWRVAFGMTALAGGTGVWLYLAAWMMMRDGHGGPAMAEQLLNRRLAAPAVLSVLGIGLLAATLLSLAGGVSWGTLVLATPLIIGVLSAHNRGVDLRRTLRELPDWLKSREPAPQAPMPEPRPAYYNPAQPWASAPHGPIDLAVLAGGAAEETAVEPEGDREEAGRKDEESGKDGESGKAPGKEGRAPRRRGLLLLWPVWWTGLALAGTAFGLAGGFSVDALVGAASAPVFLGGVIVAVGLALLVGAWFADPRGLVAVGTVLTLLLVLVTSADVAAMRFGDVTWRPRDDVEAAQGYRLTAGVAKLDLTRVPLEPGRDVRVRARVGVGSLEVAVPDDARVVVRATLGLGWAEVEGESRRGSRLEIRETLDPGPERGRAVDAPAEPPTLLIDLTSHIGDMEVRRVSA